MGISSVKQKYNELLGRYYDAEKYFNDKSIGQEEKEKHLESFREILRGLNHCLSIIGPYTREEMLGGFK